MRFSYNTQNKAKHEQADLIPPPDRQSRKPVIHSEQRPSEDDSSSDEEMQSQKEKQPKFQGLSSGQLRNKRLSSMSAHQPNEQDNELSNASHSEKLHKKKIAMIENQDVKLSGKINGGGQGAASTKMLPPRTKGIINSRACSGIAKYPPAEAPDSAAPSK